MRKLIIMGKSRIEDSKAACNIIYAIRKYDKINRVAKTLSFTLFKESNLEIAAVMTVSFNKKTGNVTFAHGLRCKRKTAFPETHGKLKCMSNRGLTYVEANSSVSCRDMGETSRI